MGDTAVLDYLAPTKTETQLSLVSANGSESTPAPRYDSSGKNSGLRHRDVKNRWATAPHNTSVIKCSNPERLLWLYLDRET